MPNIRFTKGELKRHRDALKQYQRYLPTLQLKKQQLQIEILRQASVLEEKMRIEAAKKGLIETWSGLLGDSNIDVRPWVRPKRIISTSRNIAGIDLPVFENAEFDPAEYDLFAAPLWVDAAIEALKALVLIREDIETIKTGMGILKQELRITAQRVNLFEKVKIPEAEEAIRLIKIYIGDQMTNSVGRSKIAKRKIEEAVTEEVFA